MDAVMRVVAAGATRVDGRNFLVRNIGGASGALAVHHVLRQMGDGCTVLAGNVNTAILTPLQLPHAGYATDDLVPVGMVGSTDYLAIAASSFPAGRLEDLPDLQVRLGRMLTGGHPGTETLQHMALSLLAHQLKTEFLQVPYRGSALLITDLIGSHIDIAVVAAPSVVAAVERGQIKILANITTWVASPEGGAHPPFEGWTGWFVARETSLVARDRLHATLLAALALPDVQQKLSSLGSMVPTAAHQEKFVETVKADVPRFRKRFHQAMNLRPVPSRQGLSHGPMRAK